MANSEASQAADEWDFKLYRYTPSLPAAIVGVVVFAILTLLHIWRLKRHRAYYFTAFTVGGLCMCQNSPPYVLRLGTPY